MNTKNNQTMTTTMSQKATKTHRRTHRKPKAMSAASMGKALVILATSVSALSNQSMSRTRSAATSSRGRLNDPLTNCRNDGRVVALNYRDSDEDQPISFRVANDELVASAFASKKTSKKPSPTPTRWISIPELSLPRVDHDEQQENMDEYLEYVEKRYSRMHRRSSVPRTEFHFPGKALISTFVFQTETPVSVPSPSPTEDDPLNVLGLSSLASQRLKQRLHVPREFRDEHSLLTYSTETAVLFLSPLIARKPSSDKISTEIGGRLSSSVSLSFTSQFQLMLHTLKRLATASISTINILANFTSRAIPKILEKGGVRHSVRMASVVSFAILLMFRPLFKGAMKDTPLRSFQV